MFEVSNKDVTEFLRKNFNVNLIRKKLDNIPIIAVRSNVELLKISFKVLVVVLEIYRKKIRLLIKITL